MTRYTLRASKKYTSPQGRQINATGGPNPGPYAVVRGPNIDEWQIGNNYVYFGVYLDKDSFTAGNLPFEEHRINATATIANTALNTTLSSLLGVSTLTTETVLDVIRLASAKMFEDQLQAEIDDFDGGNLNSLNGIRGNFVYADWERE